jgi:cyclopropane-fatty-acyl-phospholipid synthase
MVLFTLEHGKAAYRADFAFYGAVIGGLGLALAAGPLRGPGWWWLGMVALGLFSWTAIEYALHRYILHGLQPFQRWHAMHHERPQALIATPTVITALAFVLLVFAPAWALGSIGAACAWTLGVLIGYLAYAMTHHATHHWRGQGRWLLQRKRHHALHHHKSHGGCFGVTSGLWDFVLRTTRPRPRVADPGSGIAPARPPL